jgi:hypothetical protein
MRKANRKAYIFPISISLILISIWLFSHPYRGIVHDARLYGLQALSHIHPHIFQDDLFLKYVSQENYTLFSRLYVLVIHLTDFSTANLLLFVLAHVLWFGSAYLLCSLFYRGSLKLFSFAFVAMMPAFYSPHQIFSFGESFLTPRLFAEAFVLLSIYFALRDKPLPCAVALLLAFLTHPIVAGTGLGVLAVYFFLRNAKPALIGILVLIAISILMVSFKVPPFDGMFSSMDRDWASIIEEYIRFLFLSNWTTRDYLPIVTAFASITTYCSITRGRRQRFTLSVGIATVIFLLISLVLGDVLKNVLALQLQLWRISWLMLIFGYLTFLSIYVNIGKYFHARKSFLLVCLAAWLSPYFSSFSELYAILLLMALVSLFVSNSGPHGHKICDIPLLTHFPGATFWRGLDAFTSSLCIFLVVADYAIFIHTLYSLQASSTLLKFTPFVQTPFQRLVSGSFCFGLLCFQLRSRYRRLVLISFGALCLSIFAWDQRPKYDRLISSGFAEEGSWAKDIPLGSEILWAGWPEASWFLLNRKNYVSRLQASGIVFSHETAVLLDSRMKSVGLLKDLENPIAFYRGKTFSEIEKAYYAEVTKCCNTSSDLDFIVLPHQISEYNPRKIEFPTPIELYRGYFTLDFGNHPWYIYDCNKIRHNP